ncbi:YugN family protein [Paenibacillus sp. LHD-117]|uniref:YugN family protein n=1 Tax=Paenibacillus sp. LHD-117 TaxID=3071412 RepID=UPI0027DEC193|nr:YugN family protein [Paenibacillus sp. LHD-117]MDQ6419921.1 YugN family protein [Paenibacillus sp. LHD-117]
MIPISSSVEGQEKKFTEVQVLLQERQFSLGGNWDYDGGTFDRALDGENKVWLRIPFRVTDGNIDSELSENNAQIQFGQPFVLKHLYNEGNDPEASVRFVGAMFDQFQSPVDPDAKVERRWVERGEAVMREVENAIPF